MLAIETKDTKELGQEEIRKKMNKGMSVCIHLNWPDSSLLILFYHYFYTIGVWQQNLDKGTSSSSWLPR